MNYIRWILVSVILVFGILSTNWDSIKWIILTLFVYSIPIAFQFLRSESLRVYSIWFGVFLVLQTLVPAYLDDGYRTMPPDLKQIVDVRGNGMPGIQGLQTISTDNMGFRVTKKINYKNKPDGYFRIFAIGASTTKQTYIDDKKTWTHLLQKNLEQHFGNKKFEVINTGVSGLRARNHLATLKRIIDFQPDLVIFLVGINDWHKHIVDHFSSQGSITRKIYQLTSFNDSILGKLLTYITNFIFYKNNNSEDKNSIKVTYGEFYTNQNNSLSRPDKREFRPASVSPNYKNYMDQISIICKNSKIPCMFITQPNGYSTDAKEEYKKRFWMTPVNRDYTLDIESLQYISSLYNNYLITYASDRKLLSCDIASKIKPSLSYMYDDCHFNINGAKKVGELITTCVSKMIH